MDGAGGEEGEAGHLRSLLSRTHRHRREQTGDVWVEEGRKQGREVATQDILRITEEDILRVTGVTPPGALSS